MTEVILFNVSSEEEVNYIKSQLEKQDIKNKTLFLLSENNKEIKCGKVYLESVEIGTEFIEGV